MKIINGKTLETTDNQIIHIEGINTPDPNSHGYLQSKKDLEAILHQNATIKVIPSRMDDNGAIFAKVMLKSKNIGKIMQQKGWSGATTTFNARKMRKKNKWHEKYIHAKR
jgi:endonuclease YncB( thermonuclease family)